MTIFYCREALLPDGWHDKVSISADSDGFISAVEPGSEMPRGAVRLDGPVVPGMPNLHSHAFQRAMAGLAETAGPGNDSFWTWRKVMYGFLGRLGPEEMEAVAAQLFVDMLKAGYTSVGEFHYVHHTPSGAPYDTLTELSGRVVAAARQAGIGLTHLPVLYAHGGFGGKDPDGGQRRFLNKADRFLTLVTEIRARVAGDPQIAVGVAPHSLRAVTPDLLSEVLAGVDAIDADCPVHIHVAEQVKEVENCLAWSGQRPVAWLMAHCAVDPRWCLVHATHMDDGETAAVAASGAIAGLCPTTEANLGDGLFPIQAYVSAQGRFGIGSDSHIAVSVADELRTLEYGQRLTTRRRNVLSAGEGRSTGGHLFRAALAGGALALGRPVGAIAPGKRADLVVLDDRRPEFVGRSGDQLLDAWIFACGNSPVRHVICGGRRVIEDGMHSDETAVAERYADAVRTLIAH